jgi:hypothetical protein
VGRTHVCNAPLDESVAVLGRGLPTTILWWLGEIAGEISETILRFVEGSRSELVQCGFWSQLSSG